MRYGLVVGKFSPLHRGHEWMINEAQKQCDELLILSYSNPELRLCEAAHRRDWLKTRFPKIRSIVIDPANFPEMPRNDAPDSVQQKWLGFLLRDLIEYYPDVLFCSERWGPACATTLSSMLEWKVEAVVMDEQRTRNPVRATDIRLEPYHNAPWMAPYVRAFFITQRILLLGGESTGKSVLAELLARYYNTNHVREYGRDLFVERNGDLKFDDMLKIGNEQVWQEKYAHIGAKRYLFCDTSPLTTAGYSEWTFGQVDPKLVELARDTTYDAIIFCQADFPFVNDGTRISVEFQTKQQAWYRQKLESVKVPVLTVEGPVADRLQQVIKWLGEM